MTTPEQIDLWRQAPSEHQRLEFKEAKAQFDSRRLHEYCVALANEPTFRALGQTIAEIESADFSEVPIIRLRTSTIHHTALCRL
jgi:hypothetical protein